MGVARLFGVDKLAFGSVLVSFGGGVKRVLTMVIDFSCQRYPEIFKNAYTGFYERRQSPPQDKGCFLFCKDLEQSLA